MQAKQTIKVRLRCKELAGATQPRGPVAGPVPKAMGVGHGDHQPWHRSGVIEVDPEPAYNAGMPPFRLAVLVLGVIHALFVGLTSLAGAFADG